MNNEFSTKGSLDTFVALAKLARLKTRWANYTSRMWDTGDAIAARERAVAYIGECIAEGIYRHEPAVFCPEIQTHFRAVGLIADSDVKPAGIPIKDRPPFRFEAGHCSNQRPASFRH